MKVHRLDRSDTPFGTFIAARVGAPAGRRVTFLTTNTNGMRTSLMARAGSVQDAGFEVGQR